MEKKKDIQKTSKKKILLIAAGAVCAILAVVILVNYGKDPHNYMLAILFLMAAAGAGAGFYFAFKSESKLLVNVSGNKEDPAHPFNCINIYISEDEDGKRFADSIRFEYIENPQGHPHQLTNNGRFYYLNYSLPGQGLKPYLLMDTTYFDPVEFANVLTMPAHKKLFSGTTSMLQKLSPYLLMGGICLVGLLMVMLKD